MSKAICGIGTKTRISLRSSELCLLMCSVARGLSLAIQEKRRSRSSLAAGSNETRMLRGRTKTLENLFGGNRLRTGVGKPPSYLRGLLVAQPQRAVILFFHQLNHMRDIGLPLRRASQHAIEDFFQLGFGHARKIAHPARVSRPVEVEEEDGAGSRTAPVRLRSRYAGHASPLCVAWLRHA